MRIKFRLHCGQVSRQKSPVFIFALSNGGPNHATKAQTKDHRAIGAIFLIKLVLVCAIFNLCFCQSEVNINMIVFARFADCKLLVVNCITFWADVFTESGAESQAVFDLTFTALAFPSHKKGFQRVLLHHNGREFQP